LPNRHGSAWLAELFEILLKEWLESLANLISINVHRWRLKLVFFWSTPEVQITCNPGETFLDRMISLVEGATRQNRMVVIAAPTSVTNMTGFLASVIAWITRDQRSRR
jgi:hypothetical protein